MNIKNIKPTLARELNRTEQWSQFGSDHSWDGCGIFFTEESTNGYVRVTYRGGQGTLSEGYIYFRTKEDYYGDSKEDRIIAVLYTQKNYCRLAVNLFNG